MGQQLKLIVGPLRNQRVCTILIMCRTCAGEVDMTAATERIVVLMTRSEKRALELKAKRIGASTAELVRRSVNAFDPEADSGEIEKLLKLLAASHRATLVALDKADRELAETRAYFAAKLRGAAS